MRMVCVAGTMPVFKIIRCPLSETIKEVRPEAKAPLGSFNIIYTLRVRGYLHKAK